MRTILSGLVALVCAVAFAAPAEAKQFTFAYSLEVARVSGTAASRFDFLEVGDLLHGRFTLETELTDTEPDEWFAIYSYASSSLPEPDAPVLYLDIGSLRLSYFDAFVLVGDNTPIGEDFFALGVINGFVPVLDIESAYFDFFFLTNVNLDVFNSDAVPTAIPVDRLESKYSGGLGIEYSDGTYAWFDIVPTDIQPVPEPSSLLLMASGIAGAVYVARRKR